MPQNGTTLITKFQQKFAQEASCDFNKFFNDFFSALPHAELFLVGGMVRDILLDDQHGKDYDFVCRNVQLENLLVALKKIGKVDVVGLNFGVIKFIPNGAKLKEAIDIALPRKDFAAGTGGYRDMEAQVDPTLPVEEDLARRDLTINAIAWNIRKQILIDPFDGQRDLTDGIIRSVGEPEKRFQEDYSRILRAIRFACRFGFKIEKQTWTAMLSLAQHLNDTRVVGGKQERVVPWETIGKETSKAIRANPRETIKLLDESGALNFVLPELLPMKNCPQPEKYHSEGDVWTHTMMMLEKMEGSKFKKEFPKFKTRPDFIFAILLHDAGKPLTIKTPEKDGVDRIRFDGHDVVAAKLAEEVCRRLKLPKKEKTRIIFLIKNHMLTMQGKISEMRSTTIEKYYMGTFGADLLTFLWLDAGCSVREDGGDTHQNYRDIKTRVKTIREQLNAITEKLPESIVSGDEIMNALGIDAGKSVGTIKDHLRELQLNGQIRTKADAIKYLKENAIKFKT